MTKIAMSKIVEGNECEAIGTESKIEIRSYAHAIEPPAESDIEHRMRGDWRPPAEIP
jgi:hypothetical protein